MSYQEKCTLDHCYIILKNAYRSVSQAALGLLKHCLVYLLPTNKQKLRSAKPVEAKDSEEMVVIFLKLQPKTWMISLTLSHPIPGSCENMCVPTKTFHTYNNKPWFTAKLWQLCRAKENTYNSGDRNLYKQV